MNHVERFQAVMHFQQPDRLPIIEWATWWDKTIARWHGEGLDPKLQDAGEIGDYFGLDCYRQYWINPTTAATPAAPSHGAAIITSMADYERILPTLYPEPQQAFDHQLVASWAQRRRRGEMVVWITLVGSFWGPRVLLGIEPHLTAFYDQPELMHRINQDHAAFNIRMIEAFCQICPVDFMTFAEDMSYNHGPMISEKLFDAFMAPYYRQVVPVLNKHHILPLVDSDGDIMPIIPWLEKVGVQGILPLERMAGVDVAELRRRHPQWRMIGAFDKTVMHLGEARMRQEFERLLPVMKSGGFIPSVDHQTPPGVSFGDYQLYLKLLREYAQKGA